MRIKRWLLYTLVLTMAGCISECNPLPNCGIFTFTGTKIDKEDVNGLDMNLSFDFDPAGCGKDCTCNPVAYVQIVRTVDEDNGTFIYPSSEKEERATPNGWYIDRLEGKIWGYYGRNDDGTFADILVPGTEANLAVLFDSPARVEEEPWVDIWWQAVSVPVCIEESSGCGNKLLGFYFWSWMVDEDGVTSDPIHSDAWESHDVELGGAIEAWNAQAPGLGKNVFPSFTKLQ